MPRVLFGVLLALLLGASRAGYAQTKPLGGAGRGVVQGVVLDSASGQPLRDVSVSLLLARDSSYVTFALSDGSGRYTLRGVRPGRYVLLATNLGYKVGRQPLEMPASQAAVEVPPLRLLAETQRLGEVVVTHERAPVSMHGDTVAFSAQAFRTQPNAAVEQLLKKLPGVEIARDGSIRAQGRAVDNVLVDGKPFFGGDPKMATRNLPADIIDQVELYDRQADQAAFSGIDSGERQRTINLVTRRDRRRGYFGTQQVGAGLAGRYQARLGLNRFDNGQQLSALAQADNVNRQGFTDEGNPAAGSPGAPLGDGGSFSSGSGGLALAAPGGVRNATAGNSQPGTETGVTESASGGLNYRDAWGQRVAVAGSYLAARATTLTDQQARRQNLTGDANAPVPLTDRLADSHLRTISQRANLQLDCQLDSLTSLRLTPSLNWQTTDQQRTATQQTSLAGSLLNQSASRYDAQARSFTGGGQALLLRKFKRPDRTLSVNFNLNLASHNGLAFNQSANTFYTSAGAGNASVINQQFDQRTPTQQGALSFSYAEPFSLRHKLEAHYSYTAAPSQAHRRTTDYDASSGHYDFYNPLLSNDFTSRYATHRAGLTWQTHRLRYTYNVGFDAQQAALGLDNQTTATRLRRTYFSLLPTANFSYTGQGSRTVRLSYRTLLTAPTATQLQPVPDNSNPLSIQLGNPALRPEYTHSLTATYQHFDPARGRSVLALLAGSAGQQRIVSATTFDVAGVRATQPVNANGYFQANGYLSLSQRLPAHQLNLSASSSANLTRSPSFINGQPNVARTWSLGETSAPTRPTTSAWNWVCRPISLISKPITRYRKLSAQPISPRPSAPIVTGICPAAGCSLLMRILPIIRA